MKKSILIISSVALLILGVLSLLPAFEAHGSLLAYGIVAVAVLVLIVSFALPAETSGIAPAESAELAEPAGPAEPETQQPKVADLPEQSSEVQVAQLLSLLQENGRFLDFVMDDIKSYPDAQIAAAARFVHQGCQAVMKRNFALEPISTEAENQAITLDASYERSAYRLSGKVEGEAPFTGVLKHKGWRTTAISLPKVMGQRAQAKGAHTLAAAEVEVS